MSEVIDWEGNILYKEEIRELLVENMAKVGTNNYVIKL